MSLDIVVAGGTVVDGTGAAPYRTDIGISGGRVVAVRPGLAAPTGLVIDATGLVVTPGLIDPHSHTDWSVLGNRDAHSTIRQGVTTEIVGNCGVTYAPLTDATASAARAALAAFGHDGEVDWRSFGELLERVHRDGGGTAQNLAWFVGHTALREAAGASGPDVTGEQLRTMRRLLADALDSGALGMSTGLEYGAGRESRTAELSDLAAMLAGRGGMYASHIRNRDAGLAGAVEEFFRVARPHGLAAQLSHLNVRHNTGAPPDGWQRAVERLQAERDAGLDVLADMTPYPDGIGLAAGLLPGWLLANGAAAAAQRLGDPGVRRRVRADSDRYWRFVHRGEWDRVVLATSPATPEWEGLSFPEIARRRGRDEWDCFLDVLEAAGPDLPAVQLVGRLFTEEHVAEAVAHPLFCLGVDGFSSRTDGPLAARTRHPLFFSGHTHYLAHHVLQRGTLGLTEAVHKMTAMVADHFGLDGRGRLTAGAWADVAVLDTATLARQETFRLPDGYAAGVPYVIVNGALVVDRGEHRGVRAGRFLPRST